MSDKVYISRDGLQKLKNELEALNAERMKVAGDIEAARELGDLKENAEYHAAKEKQAMLHAQIAELEGQVTRAVVLEDQDIDTSKAYLGATVKALNKKTKKEVSYTLVSPVEADMAAGKISTESPVGKALLGGSIGDTVAAKIPAGDLILEILDITR